MAKTGFNGFTQPRPDRSGTNTGDANAAAADILVTKSGYVRGVKVNGAMIDRSGAGVLGSKIAYNGNLDVKPAIGFYDGNTTINIPDPNFITANIRSDQTMFGMQGVMPNRALQVNDADCPTGDAGSGYGHIHPQSNGSHDGAIFMQPPPGYYDGGSNNWLFRLDSNFIAANIPSGMSMLGLTGTGTNAKRKATGQNTSGSSYQSFTTTSGTAANSGYLTVSGLGFKPTIIYYYRDTVKGGAWGVYTETNDGWYTNHVYTQSQSTTSGGTIGANAFKGDVSPAAVTNGSFTIPVQDYNTVYTWIAYE